MYIVPKNVKTRFEFFEGFGWKEFFVTIIGAAVGGIITTILFSITKSIFAILPIGIGGAIAFVISRPDPRTGISPMDYVKSSRNFQKKTKLYFYVKGGGKLK